MQAPLSRGPTPEPYSMCFMRQLILLLGLVVPGVFCFVCCLYYALQDWAALQRAYGEFARVAVSSSDMRVLFVAEARQNIHRINLFADVVWALLGAIVAAIGIHGLCVHCPLRTSASGVALDKAVSE